MIRALIFLVLLLKSFDRSTRFALKPYAPSILNPFPAKSLHAAWLCQPWLASKYHLASHRLRIVSQFEGVKFLRVRLLMNAYHPMVI